MGTIKTTNIETITGSGTLTLGQSGETISVPTGATLDLSNATQTGVGGTNTPAFSAQMSGAQTLSHNSTTKVTFNTEIFDTDGCYDSSTNYRFTPTTAGKYNVNLNLYCDAQGQGNWRIYGLNIYKNGSVFSSFSFDMATGYGNNGIMGLSSVITMNGSSDYLEAFAYVFTQDSSTSPVGGSTTHTALFSAYKLIGV
jgi:hypothetical protein